MKIQLIHSKYAHELLARSATGILESNVLLSMATIAGHDSWINTAFYCFSESWELFILTEIDSKHCRNIAVNNSIAVAIYDSRQSWGLGQLRGIQAFGVAETAREADLIQAIGLYTARFPGATKWLTTADDFEKELVGSCIIKIVPKSIKILDEPAFGPENFVQVQIVRTVPNETDGIASDRFRDC